MTNRERNLLVAERVVGWKWEIRETSKDYWTRTILPPEQLSKYTTIWDGQDCDYVDVAHIKYFKPSTDPVAAAQVKDHMEEVHGFFCEINYFTGPAEPWCVMFKNFHVKVRRVGGTLHEAIVRVVLDDEIMGHLKQA